MNNQGIQSLRVPAAWALLGAVAVQMLGGLIHIFGVGGEFNSPARNISEIGSSAFFGPVAVALIIGAVFLVVTGPSRSAAFPVVLTSLILAGIGALMGVLTLIMGFVAASDIDALGYGFATFFETAAHLAILVIAGLFLIKVFSDETLVPRAQPPAMGQPGYPQGFASQTGAQQSFQQQAYADPNQSYGALGLQQQGYVDPSQQQAYADPNQSYGALGLQQQGYDPNQQAYVQQSGGQPAYGQDWYQQQGYDPNQQAYGLGYVQQSGGQPAYGQDWYQQQGYDPNQQAYVQQSGGQPAYGQDWYQQQGYDPNQQAYVQQSGGQPAYGQDWYQQQGYDPNQQAYVQQSGGQPAYGQDWYQQQGYDPNQQAYVQQSGGQPAYGQDWYQQQGYDPNQQAYAQSWAAEQQMPYAGQPGYTTGGQPAGYDAYASYQAYGTGTGGQSAHGGGYDPSAYGAQGYGDAAAPGQPEQAAQDAIQYGWHQQPADQAGERHDTPTEQFFGVEGQPGYAADPGYAQYGTGTAYGENYPADQQEQSDAGGEAQQPWYRDEDRR